MRALLFRFVHIIDATAVKAKIKADAMIILAVWLICEQELTRLL